MVLAKEQTIDLGDFPDPRRNLTFDLPKIFGKGTYYVMKPCNIHTITGHFIRSTVAWMLVPDGLLSISENVDLQWLLSTVISRVYREWSRREKIAVRQLCGQKCLDVRSQRRRDGLLPDVRESSFSNNYW